MICFALCAHQGEWNLRKQIENIRKYNPENSMIVFYNGGHDPDFGKKICKRMNVHYCSYSRPLTQRSSGRFFLDVMRWLEDNHMEYEYLVYMEYDIMFVKPGFGEFLPKQLGGHDILVKFVKKETDPELATWNPAKEMWKDWERWRSFFGTDYYYRSSSPMAVFRRRMVRAMLEKTNLAQLEDLLQTSSIPCIGEMLFITLAINAGGSYTTYRWTNRRFLRFRPNLRIEELQLAKTMPEIMFVHPVKDMEVRNWLFRNS